MLVMRYNEQKKPFVIKQEIFILFIVEFSKEIHIELERLWKRMHA